MRVPNKSIDYTSKDYEAYRSMMIKGLQERMPEYTDTSQTDAGIVILEQLARGLDVLSMYQDVYANEAFFLTAKNRESAVRWSKGLGYIPRNRTAAIHQQVFVKRDPSIEYEINVGLRVRTPESSGELPIVFETIETLVIPAGQRGDEKDSDGRYLYTAKIMQGMLISRESLGTSNGLPNQEFKLGYKSAIGDSIKVYVNEGGGWLAWTQVKTFIDSKSDDRHYVVEVNEFDETFIKFGTGNGLLGAGKIPFADSTVSSRISCTYRIGGGEVGNLAPHTIKEFVSPNSFLEETFNPYTDYTPGADKESLTEIKQNAPAFLRVLWRAVTLQDHADLVLINYANVKLATATHDPHDRNNVMIFILQRGNPDKIEHEIRFNSWKYEYPFTNITQNFKRDLFTFFDQRKMVGNGVDFFPPEFFCLRLMATVSVKDYYVQSEVMNNAKQVTEEYFKLGEYPFGKDLVLNDLEAFVLSECPGVKSYRIGYAARTVGTINKSSSLYLVLNPMWLGRADNKHLTEEEILNLGDIIRPKKQELIVLSDLTLNMYGGEVSDY